MRSAFVALLSTGVCFMALSCPGDAGVKNLIKNSGFEEGKKHWIVGQGTVAEFNKGIGRNQTRGLKITVAPNRRGTVTQLVTGFKRGQKYEVTAWIRADRNGWGSLTMDVTTKKGAYLSGKGFYGGRNISSRDWTMFRQIYQHKGEDPEQHQYRFVLLSFFNPRSKDKKNPDAAGNIWYDDIMVVPAIPEWTLNQVYPSHESISVKGGEVEFSSFFEPSYIPPGTELEALATMKYVGTDTEKAVKATVKKGFITLQIPPGKAGTVSLRITIRDRKTGKSLGEKIMPLNIREELQIPPHAAMLDEKGRLWVNGKKFMPLGVYCNINKDGISPAFLKHVDKVSSLGSFNCIMPYGVSFYVRSDKDLIRLLDETGKRDMKLLLGCHDFLLAGLMGSYRKSTKTELEPRVKHITELIGRHPALLAYYGNDEMGVDRIAVMQRGRRLLNKYDPFHPVWGVSYQVEAYEHYLPSVNILAYDTYPVRKDGTNFHTRWWASKARSLTAAVWGVPQCYERDKGVHLTVENMLSPCAVHIIYEARGFVFWTTGPNNSFEKGKFDETRWEQLAEVGKTLKGLEEFILSDIPGKKLEVKNFKEDTEAVLLDNGKGSYRIVAAGIYKNHHSEISIPRNLKLVSSKFGHLKEKEPGILVYEGGVVTCDFGVLEKR